MSEVRAVETGPKARRGKLALGVAFVSSLLALTPAKAEGQFSNQEDSERLCEEYTNSSRRAEIDRVVDGGEGFLTHSEHTDHLGILRHDVLDQIRDRLQACLQIGGVPNRSINQARLNRVETEIRAREAYGAAANRTDSSGRRNVEAGFDAYDQVYAEARLNRPGS